MSSTVVLDARPLSQIAHPRKYEAISAWSEDVVASGRRVVILEIIDYEVRRTPRALPSGRGLLRLKATRQIKELDQIKAALYYFPLSTELMMSALMMSAAQVWADARRMGKPFTSDDRLDGDAILIAQAQALGDRRSVTVITENVKHLAPFVNAMPWRDFIP